MDEKGIPLFSKGVYGYLLDTENSSYAKILVADENYIQNILEREREELLLLYEENTPDVRYLVLYVSLVRNIDNGNILAFVEVYTSYISNQLTKSMQFYVEL